MPRLLPIAAALAALACVRRPASTRAFVLPESLAHDPGTGSFYIGSMHRRKIVRRSVDGRVSDWAGPAEGLWSIVTLRHLRFGDNCAISVNRHKVV